MDCQGVFRAAPSLLLALAITAVWATPQAEPISAALTSGAIVLGLCGQARSRTWALGVAMILVLNLRGILLAEGPRPVSHMDYVLLIAAFLAGQGQSLVQWRWLSRSLCLAVAAAGLAQIQSLWIHLWNPYAAFHLGFLLVNQTALLAGLGCMAGLAALALSQRCHSRVLMGVASLCCGLMVLATHSRAGLGLIPISLVIAWLLRPGALEQLCCAVQLKRRGRVLALVVAIALAGALLVQANPLKVPLPQPLPQLSSAVGQLYGQENRISDQGRLALWRCYASLPFSGNNRFLYGVGYGRARELCPVTLPGHERSLTHAHNLPLQIWADAGSLPLLALLAATAALGIRLRQQQRWGSERIGLTLLVVYPVLFNLVELGMLKVPLLTALFGMLLSAALAEKPALNDG
jgi:O-Antigen ligase